MSLVVGDDAAAAAAALWRRVRPGRCRRRRRAAPRRTAPRPPRHARVGAPAQPVSKQMQNRDNDEQRIASGELSASF